MPVLCLCDHRARAFERLPLACLTSLEELELSSNALVGPLPESWTGMRQLRTLAMSHNPGLGAFAYHTLVPIQYDRVGVVNADS